MSLHQFGAKLWSDGHCEWRVWAPRATQAEVVLFDDNLAVSAAETMDLQSHGFFVYEIDRIEVGQRYAFRLNEERWFPDPASKWQPDGVHQPSAVWRAEDFTWTDRNWSGLTLSEYVIYELHVGTFTPAGTFAAVIPRLRELKDLGITAIELMPVGQFPGERGWGYDGAYWFAAQQSYGGPTELQRLVDACHAHGLSVILDVVYNHLGPEGNYLREFGPFFTDRHQTPWGEGINYDGPECRVVHDFVLANVRQWIRDFHIDGLRLDAVHAIEDEGEAHVLAEVKQVAEAEAMTRGVPVYIVAESNLNDARLLDPPAEGGHALDAQWNDDFHHCVHALLTGERAGYYADFHDPARQLVKAFNDVFVYDGCDSPYRQRPHGSPAGDHSGEQFIVSIQTHDQVGNRALGDRFGTLLDPAQQRLAAGLLLLSPYVPMLFMGEEYGETKPFPFFCDFGDAALRDAIRHGRRDEFASFGWTGDLPDPNSHATFASAVLSWNWPDGSHHAGLRILYQELLSLRRAYPAFRNSAQPSVKLIENSEESPVLLLRRGFSDRSLTAAFNLGLKPALFSSLIPGKLILHSAEVRFGGTLEKFALKDALPPFSFAVFEQSPESPA